jgi:hypothetical protein
MQVDLGPSVWRWCINKVVQDDETRLQGTSDGVDAGMVIKLVPFKMPTSITTGAQQLAGHLGMLKSACDDAETSGMSNTSGGQADLGPSIWS